jgi:hypothetical protein
VSPARWKAAAMFKVTIDRPRPTITFRASGSLTAEELKAVYSEAKSATDTFSYGEHIVLADMRGMTARLPEASAIFGKVIKYGREHGTALCVHLSDSSVARLQTSRLAREVTPGDAVTTNVVSVQEAERMIDERHWGLKGAKPRR